jgi:C-terminal processing protease CtpA/Prc
MLFLALILALLIILPAGFITEAAPAVKHGAAVVDSVQVAAINAKYNKKQEELRKRYDERVEELLSNDAILNQLKGAFEALEIERREALSEIKKIGDADEK